jgi:hypothetical protein
MDLLRLRLRTELPTVHRRFRRTPYARHPVARMLILNAIWYGGWVSMVHASFADVLGPSETFALCVDVCSE